MLEDDHVVAKDAVVVVAYVWDIRFGFDVICFLQEWRFIPSEVINVCLIHIWLVVDTNPSEKYESVSQQLGL